MRIGSGDPSGDPFRAQPAWSACLLGRLAAESRWHTPAERYDDKPFTARGFERIPVLDHLQGWLTELMTV